MWDGFDKRRFPRINLQCEITIQSQQSHSAISAVTENIGYGGVCVLLDKPLERFGRCMVKLELSDKLPRIETEGKVVWTVPTSDLKSKKPLYDTGIEFVDMDPELHRALKSYLEQNAPVSPE